MKKLLILMICLCGLFSCKKVTTTVTEDAAKVAEKKIVKGVVRLTLKDLKPTLMKALSVLPKESQEYFLEIASKNPKFLVIFEENPPFISTWDYLRRHLPTHSVDPEFIKMLLKANDFSKYSGNKLENFIYKPLKDGTIEVLSKEGKAVLAKIKPGKVIEVIGDDVNNWFLQLKPFANCKYIINGAEYLTDDAGRVIKTKVKLSPSTVCKSHRDSGVQKQMALLKNSLKGDDAGHIIADQFGGASNMLNLIPMKGDINKGAYKQMENELRKFIREGKEVFIDTSIKYPKEPPTFQRPDWIEVIYIVDGKKITKLFKNIP